MCPLEAVPQNSKERIEKANKRVYIYYRTNERCLYAADIVKQQAATNCNYSDTAEGQHAPAIEGSPMYTQTFSGMGADGLHAFPLGMYSDNLPMRNIPYGLFSLVSNSLYSIIKNAAKENECLKDIIEKTELSEEEFFNLKNLLEQCRQEYESKRHDNGKIMELIRKWDPRRT
jgi:hypothetical protein